MQKGANHIKGYIYFVITAAIVYAICLQFNMDIIGAIGLGIRKNMEFYRPTRNET